MTPDPRLSVRGLRHSFGGVQAVGGVDLDLRGGEVCALLGENGAGKSTLMKAIAGALRPDAGTVRLDGAVLPPGDPRGARVRGVAVIYQELSLVGPLPVHENVALGRERRRGPLLDATAQRREASRALARLGVTIDPDVPVESLSVAEQQLVEIARALGSEVRVLILDEPTSALSSPEAERLFRVVRSLAVAGAAIVFITHRLDEVRQIADRVVVMRDGLLVADSPADRMTGDEMIRAMVGRSLARAYPEKRRRPGDVLLEVSDLRVPPRVGAVSFDVRAGEIVALAGLVGAGRTDVGRALFGAARIEAGSVRLGGRPVRFRNPHEAVAAGIGWVSEDRKQEGLILAMDLAANLTLPHLTRHARWGILDRRGERRAARRQMERFGIRATGIGQPVRELSGGNQQKVALARWMGGAPCRLLICDEPTRGVDVGGRFDIHELLERLAGDGAAILMISSDLPELLGMADRIVVMHAGRVSGIVAAAGASQEQLLRLAMGEAA